MFAATFIEEPIFSTLYIQIILHKSPLVSYAWMCFLAFHPLHGYTFLLSFQWYDFLWDKLKLVNAIPILFFFLKNIFSLLTIFHGTLWIILKECVFNFYGNSHWNFERQLYNLHISFICIEDLVIIFVYECLTIFHLFVFPLVSFISVLQFLLHNTYSLLLFIDTHFVLLDYTKDGWFSWFLFKWVINVKKMQLMVKCLSFLLQWHYIYFF